MRKFLPLCMLLIVTCASPAAAALFTDALDRQVAVPNPPQRIVSLVPSVTEILFALGVENRIVAVTDYCTYPPQATQLPSIGSYADPSLENILLHKPDLVFAAADMNRPALVRQLEQMKIPVYVVYPHSVAETLNTIRNIGQLTGRAAAAEQLAAAIESRIAKVRRQVADRPGTTAIGCVMLQPLTVAGPDTFIDDLMTLAGGRNIVPTGPARYPTWNTEALLSTDPEVIIVSSHPGQPDAEQFFSRWPQLQAVDRKRIVRIEADWLHRPGPRMILGIEALAKAFHPDLNLDE